MLFKLSVKNILKSIKDYAIYFFTLIIGVAVFYIFNAIETQTVMLNVSKDTRDIIKLMVQMLSGVSVFVSMILGFLIIYASRFIMKRRNKEFGIYLTLGMGKRKISLILFFETLIIGIISLAAGLLLGAGLSQIMSVFVANMFEADMTRFTFIFSVAACKKTMLYFGIMYLFVMIFNTIGVSRHRLIDLLQAGKKTEQVKLKNPWLCTLVFIVSAVILGRAYYMVTGGFGKMDDYKDISVPIAMGIVSTFLIFWSLSGLLLRIFMSMKKTYYRGLNSFTLRQISSKINTTVFGMSIICLMLFVTICVLASCFSIRNTMSMQLDELAPADINMVIISQDASSADEALSEEQMRLSAMTIPELFEESGLKLDGLLADTVDVVTYQTEELTFRDSFGDYMEEISKQYKMLNYDTMEDFISISDYNRVAEIYGKDTYTLAEDEYMVVADFESLVDIRNLSLENGVVISIFGHDLKPKYGECKDGFLEMSANHINSGLFVVPDSVVAGITPHCEFLIGNYAAKTKEDKIKIEEQILNTRNDITENMKGLPLYFSISTRLQISEATVGLGAMVTFIGLYLGVIFMISSAAILALKELSESTDNVERYHMLRKLGADERMINKALFRQIGIFFLVPLLLAIIHSVFGMKFSMYFLKIFGTIGLGVSIATTAVILLVIYGGYFLITYWCSRNIIKER